MTTTAPPKTYTLTSPDGVVTTLDLPKMALRVVDMLIEAQIADNPAVARYQRVQKLCDVGNVISHLFASGIEDAQPLDEGGLGYDIGGLGYGGLGGYAAGRRVVPQQGDTAELMRTLIALAQRHYGGGVVADLPPAPGPLDPVAAGTRQRAQDLGPEGIREAVAVAVQARPPIVLCVDGVHTFYLDGRNCTNCDYTLPF